MPKVFLAALCVLSLGVLGCDSGSKAEVKPDSEAKPAETKPVNYELIPADGKIKVTVMKEGTSKAPEKVAKTGDLAVVNYRGTLRDGTEFDSNLSPEKVPYSFVIGSGQSIEGMEKGVDGMAVGEKRKIEIPYTLGYGKDGYGEKIPPGSNLIFEVELLYVVKENARGDYDVKDIKVGTGPGVKKGDKVKVHYTGTFLNGKKFDSSKDRGTPFDVTVGAGQVIKGWDEGLVDMKVGGTRTLVLPPDLAYGAQGSGEIPPNSVLKFEIELVEIVK